jgi:hypothetical protein
MNETAPVPNERAFTRGPAFISGTICSLLAYLAVLVVPLSFSGPVKGDPDHKLVFAGPFIGALWLIGLIAAIALPVAIWKRKATVAWWMYPFFLVTFCVGLIIFMVICGNLGVGMTKVPQTPLRR